VTFFFCSDKSSSEDLAVKYHTQETDRDGSAVINCGLSWTAEVGACRSWRGRSACAPKIGNSSRTQESLRKYSFSHIWSAPPQRFVGLPSSCFLYCNDPRIRGARHFRACASRLKRIESIRLLATTWKDQEALFIPARVKKKRSRISFQAAKSVRNTLFMTRKKQF
jgi:hypothetical protein